MQAKWHDDTPQVSWLEGVAEWIDAQVYENNKGTGWHYRIDGLGVTGGGSWEGLSRDQAKARCIAEIKAFITDLQQAVEISA